MAMETAGQAAPVPADTHRHRLEHTVLDAPGCVLAGVDARVVVRALEQRRAEREPVVLVLGLALDHHPDAVVDEARLVQEVVDDAAIDQRQLPVRLLVPRRERRLELARVETVSVRRVAEPAVRVLDGSVRRGVHLEHRLQPVERFGRRADPGVGHVELPLVEAPLVRGRVGEDAAVHARPLRRLLLLILRPRRAGQEEGRRQKRHKPPPDTQVAAHPLPSPRRRRCATPVPRLRPD